MLFVKMSASVGGYYTKKNIFTAFGAEPFFVAGGVVTYYTLVGGPNGAVIASGVVPFHGGYVSASNVEKRVNASR